ncbi:MAG: hypothetical protein E6R00_00865 [Gammaproteobacteria bacterium]|nr:MAG: hypothetical protein E6R00_00865 [Gammaproteobacteria bacterium]
MTPAEMLRAAIAGTQGHNPTPITDEFAKAIARELDQTKDGRAGQVDTEHEAAEEPKTAAEVLAAEIAKGSMPLNGPGILRAALGG